MEGAQQTASISECSREDDSDSECETAFRDELGWDVNKLAMLLR